MKKPPIRVQMARELRQLRAKLTSSEHVAKAEELAKEIGSYDALMLAHKAARARMREREKAQELSIREIATDVGLGSEVRDIACRWVADFARNSVELIRLDTGAVVESRPMGDSDRQLAIEHRVRQDDLDDIPIEPPQAEPIDDDTLPPEAQ